MTQENKFRIKAKSVFITYPQSGNTTKEEIGDFIKNKRKCKNIIVAQEKHQDGNNHIHVHTTFQKIFDSTNCRYFDYNGLHPNIQSVRNVNAVRNYIMKDDNYIYDGYTNKPVNKNNWQEAMELVEDNKPREAIKLLKKNQPKDMFKFGETIERNINRYAPNQIHIDRTFRFKDNDKVLYWKRCLTHKKVLWMIGKTNTGKTAYAKSLWSNPLLVRHIDDLKTYNETNDCIIFDDMSFKHWPRNAAIHITDLDDDSSINVKHSTARIPRGVPRMFTSNDYIWPDDNHGAIQRRIFTVVINEDLRIIEEDIDAFLQSDDEEMQDDGGEKLFKFIHGIIDEVDRSDEPFDLM